VGAHRIGGKKEMEGGILGGGQLKGGEENSFNVRWGGKEGEREKYLSKEKRNKEGERKAKKKSGRKRGRLKKNHLYDLDPTERGERPRAP